MTYFKFSDFHSRLEEAVSSVGSSLCIGCDPRTETLPSFFHSSLKELGSYQFLCNYGRSLIDAGLNLASAIKVQSAFFEAHGDQGFRALAEVISYARKRKLFTILDAKRGDIASTMIAYGKMAFDHMGADSLTVTPYMGLDTVKPLVPWLTKGFGIYLVWITSNPSGSLLQDCLLKEHNGPMSSMLFNNFANFFESEGLLRSYGLVLGATRVTAVAENIRSKLGDCALLIPGVGAQGGQIDQALKCLLANRKALVPQSRSVGEYSDKAKSWSDYSDIVRERIRAASKELSID